MPCWYFDKRELQKTPSYNDGINAETEAKYRREGARFIMDAGSKMKLHYNTCATGVVYFHRFFLFHSFKEFHRHVMAACCLFLAGKVEETPKKCRDLIKITQSMLSEEEFAAFGKDPREEVMTLERILLQTIKFDLMVEHPYAYVVKFAKQFKGDKSKLEKMAQMAWTFVNDSLCTTLCLQWEAEVIAVAMMYLTSRLSKFEPLDWHGRPSGFRGKWYEFLVKDVTLELLEDVCHQVLDLYSKPHLKSDTSAPHQSNPPLPPSDDSTKSTPKTPCSPQVAKKSGQGSSQSSSRHSEADSSTHSSGSRSKPSSSAASAAAGGPAAAAGGPAAAAGGPAVPPSNPYPSAQTSFMSGEGKQSIQSLISGDMSAGSSFQRSGQPVPPYNQFQVGPYNQNFPPPPPGTMPYGYDMRSQQYHGTAMQVDPPAPPANGDRQPHWQ